jgi:hypothetical protein
MLNSVIGVGIVALPAAMSKTGWMLGVALILCIAAYANPTPTPRPPAPTLSLLAFVGSIKRHSSTLALQGRAALF